MIIDSVTSGLVAKALDTLSLNHKLIASNVANIGVSGYTAKRIDFKDAMSEVESLLDSDSSDLSTNEKLASIDLTEFIGDDLKEPVLESQMLNLTANTLRYESLIRANSELGAILKTAISGGRI